MIVKSFWSAPIVIAVSVALVGCDQLRNLGGGTPAQAPDGIVRIWWSEGYFPEETEAVRNAVESWSETSGIQAELIFFSEKDLEQQTLNAITAGTPPEIVYGYSIDQTLLPRLAWEGKLVDVSDILQPLQNVYSAAALQSVFYQNNADNTRSYYAMPISQQTTHIHYWRDLIAEAGLSEADIPTEWDDFWNFWRTVQDNLRAQPGNDERYGLGLPMSTAAYDTFLTLEQFFEAYGVELVNAEGEFVGDTPANRALLVEALNDYASHYRDGYVPPNAIDWADPDNNVTFLSSITVMTPNPTMSIPGSQRQDRQTYTERMATIPWPNTPSGQPMRYITSVKQVAILRNSGDIDEAKDFLAYLVQPDVLQEFVEGAQGRFYPVMPGILTGEFWTSPDDPHISVASQQFATTRPPASVLNPAYSQVQSQNIWGQAVRSMVVDGVSAEDAIDTALEAITTIFTEWR